MIYYLKKNPHCGSAVSLHRFHMIPGGVRLDGKCFYPLPPVNYFSEKGLTADIHILRPAIPQVVSLTVFFSFFFS